MRFRWFSGNCGILILFAGLHWEHPPRASFPLAVSRSRFPPQVGGGSAFYVKRFSAQLFMKTLALLAVLSGIAIAGSGCGPKATVTPNMTHLTATAAGHQITADIEGAAYFENQNTQAVIKSRSCSDVLITTSGIYMGTNQTSKHKWTQPPDGVPISFHITHDKFSVQWSTNQ